MIGGRRQRVYLDQLEWMAGLIGNRADSLETTTVRSIGELAYSALTPSDAPDAATEVSGLASGETTNARDRIAALIAGGMDPLEAAILVEESVGALATAK